MQLEENKHRRASSEVVVVQRQYEVLKFAPEEIQRESASIDQCGEAIIDMLQSAGQQFQADKDRINELESEIGQIRERAKKWLQLIAYGITEKR